MTTTLHYALRYMLLNQVQSEFIMERTQLQLNVARYQQVSYAGIISLTLPLRLGVPQGSILDPLLFLIYINAIVNCSYILQLVLFADYTSAFIIGLNYADLFQIMNEELSKLSGWFQVNKLSIVEHFQI